MTPYVKEIKLTFNIPEGQSIDEPFIAEGLALAEAAFMTTLTEHLTTKHGPVTKRTWTPDPDDSGRGVQ